MLFEGFPASGALAQRRVLSVFSLEGRFVFDLRVWLFPRLQERGLERGERAPFGWGFWKVGVGAGFFEVRCPRFVPGAFRSLAPTRRSSRPQKAGLVFGLHRFAAGLAFSLALKFSRDCF